MPTPKQLAANRLNAKKSTGPKTNAGKAATSKNALKYGVFSESVLVASYNHIESPYEFALLWQEFYDSLAPVGPIEEALVEQILTAVWRMRRARKAESGEISLGLDRDWRERDLDNPVRRALALSGNPFTKNVFTRLYQSSEGSEYVISWLKKLRQRVEREGELSAEIITDINEKLKDEPQALGPELEQFRVRLVENPGQLDPDALKSQHLKEVFEYLDNHIQEGELLLANNQDRDGFVKVASQSAGMLPSDATMDKILRYETAIERQMFRAMNQLERLQRQRKGENVPPPLAVDISTRP